MAFNKKTIRDIDVGGKTILLRASLNVPIEEGQITDVLRLKSALPTIDYLLDHKAKVILISHHSEKGQSLAAIAPELSKLLGKNVGFVHDCVGPEVEKAVHDLSISEVLMLENLRFHKEEESNDIEFAKKLASVADIYVDDDFTTTHREHASMVEVPKLLPSVAGLQIEREVETIAKAMEDPKRPLLVIVGGAKISTKIDFIDNFLDKAQVIMIGGAMANTFLAAQGLNIGKSLSEESEIVTAQRVVNEARQQGVELFLPKDVVVTDDIDHPTSVKVVGISEIKGDDIIADLGPKSVAQVQAILNQKGTVIWNGPLGVTENPVFAKGSTDLAKRIIDSGIVSLIGGGDTAGFIDSLGWHDKFSFVSTGGGASLELMSGKKLPAIEVLQDK